MPEIKSSPSGGLGSGGLLIIILWGVVFIILARKFWLVNVGVNLVATLIYNLAKAAPF